MQISLTQPFFGAAPPQPIDHSAEAQIHDPFSQHANDDIGTAHRGFLSVLVGKLEPYTDSPLRTPFCLNIYLLDRGCAGLGDGTLGHATPARCQLA